MIGSDPDRGMAFDQSLPFSAPRHARVTFGAVARPARRSIDASATYDPTGIIVASIWLAFYVVIRLL
jgi:hypothetical protein